MSSVARRRISARIAIAVVVLVAAVGALLMTASTAEAIDGAKVLCVRDDYGCVSSGYKGKDPWGYWRNAMKNAYGYHNCTSYVAFRAAQNGAVDKGFLGDASDWDENARTYGIPVDGTPAVGAIAQWNEYRSGIGEYGHVAYVEEVGANYIVITDDNYSWNKTTRQKITRTSGGWPSNFIHLKDEPVDRSKLSGKGGR